MPVLHEMTPEAPTGELTLLYHPTPLEDEGLDRTTSQESMTGLDTCSSKSSSLDILPLTPCLKQKQQRRRQIKSLHSYLIRTSITAATASAAIGDGQRREEQSDNAIDDDASDRPAGWLRAIFGVRGSSGQRQDDQVDGSNDDDTAERPAGWLRTMFGAPPRHSLDAPRPSLPLLVAGDLSLCCAIAGLVLVVSAFTADNGFALEDDGNEEMPYLESMLMATPAPTASGKKVPGKGVLLVVGLSAMAGGALNVKHALRSALLCGV